MKSFHINIRLKVLLFLGIVLLSNRAYSQNCGTTTHCPDKAYEYSVCEGDDGKIIRKCLKDPASHNVLSVKPTLPICLNFLSSGNSQAYIESESGHDILVYDETYIITDEVDSETAWNCLCGTFPPPCNCEIDFEFSDDPDDFFPSAGSTIGLARWNYFSYSCLLRCSKSKIYINNTREFTGSAPSNPAKKYAYHINNGILASDPGLIDQLPPYATVYNLTNLLTHELGHILGLGHHTKTDGSKACPEESNGIMNATTAGNDYKENLSTDDICAFKKLHCPGLVGVDDHQFLSSGPN